MHKKVIGAIMLMTMIYITACEQQTTVTLPEDRVLIDMIYDLHIAEAAMNRVNATRKDSISTVLRDRIASSYQTTPEQMDIWLETLQKSPDHLNLVYDSVIARLEQQIPK